MPAEIIDGKAIAAELRAKIANESARIAGNTGRKPGLAVVLVGEDPASQVYVRNKHKAAIEAGFNSFETIFPADISEKSLISELNKLNDNSEVDGILVQLPLPAHISSDIVINTINPAKDVDGFHPLNSGKLFNGRRDGFLPCTPLGCLYLLKRTISKGLAGKNAVVIGRSNIVGKPMAALLLSEDCTVTITHSKTRNLAEITANADILVSATGKPEFVKKEWVKKGAVVIDVGINRVENKLKGDVDFKGACENASFITPVPGGVGPMTIACLMYNTLKAYCKINEIKLELEI
jgi:methylenetetrahydrofolate dehydrogenase (NADP+) / methenyltetrahydrofolate cyclohydrolase